MARARSPKREEAEKIWLDSGGKMPLIEIAAILGLGDTHVRKWKSQDRWENKLRGEKVTLPKKREKSEKVKSNVTNENGTEKRAGRPTKYKEEYAQQAYKLCLLGATDKDLADFFDVAESTINEWKLEHEEFSEAIRRGKVVADAEIANSLYHRAKGYKHPEDKIFQVGGKPLIVPTTKHYPPDTAAALIWLKNRQKDKWRDKQDVSLTGDVTIDVKLTD